MDQSKQVLRDYCGDGNGTCTSSLREITLIETVTSFLEENGAAEIDRKVLRKLAEALSKSIDDTSPGALQDVTMENSYASFEANRPPGGSHSPMALQGRSVRELEEQMSTLRKENFNLKLRIYFMEEGQPGARSNHIGEPTSKQLIDAKIQVEVLRKTIEEKTELLREAARAITDHEEIQRKAELESQTMIEHLQQQIRGYEAAARVVHPSAAIDAEKLIRLEREVHRLENELQEADVRHKAVKSQMEFALAERLDTVMSCEAKIEELAIKNAELVERLQSHSESSDAAHKTIAHLRAEIGGCQDENRRLTSAFNAAESELKRQNDSMKEASETLNIQLQSIELLESNIKHKDASYSRLMERVLDLEALTDRQTAELDTLKQETQYYRDLSESLQQKQRLERVAIVPPMRTMADSRDGYSSSYSIDRSGSSSSLSSNFSSLTVLCGRGGPIRESLSQWSLAQSSPTATVPEADAPAISSALATFSREPATDPPIHEYSQQSVAAISRKTCDAARCCCAQHRLLQILAAKFDWVPAAPSAIWHFALKLTFLSVRLQTCLLSTGIPMYVDRQGATSASVRIVLTSLLCPNCRGTHLDERKPLIGNSPGNAIV